MFCIIYRRMKVWFVFVFCRCVSNCRKKVTHSQFLSLIISCSNCDNSLKLIYFLNSDIEQVSSLSGTTNSVVLIPGNVLTPDTTYTFSVSGKHWHFLYKNKYEIIFITKYCFHIYIYHKILFPYVFITKHFHMYLSLSTACKDVFIIKYCFHMYYHQVLFPYMYYHQLLLPYVSSSSTVSICITKYSYHMYHHQVLLPYVSPSTVTICITKYCYHMYHQVMLPYV